MSRFAPLRSVRHALVVLACAWTAGVPAAVAADDADARLERLEQRIEELEAEKNEQKESAAAGARSDWTRFLRLSGSANVGWYDGQVNSVLAGSGFQVRDARFFLDAELGEALQLFGYTVVRNAGFSFEWDLVRIGLLRNTVGEAYAELQGIGGSDWVNVQLGRFQVPVGEAYLRYSKGRWKNVFVSQPVGGTWWWDEGLKIYGGDASGLFSYVASMTENETRFNGSVSGQKQYSIKLITEPTRWLRLSGSFLYGGDVGSATSSGSGGGLWLGETWARGIGVNTTLPVVQDGVAVADGPLKVDGSWYAGGDAIFEFEDKASIWLSYGAWDIDSAAPGYDRRIHTWTAEVVVYGDWLTDRLDTVYLGARASGLGTYDDDRGYSYDFRTLEQIGYNARSLEEYSAVLGWRPIPFMVLRTEYTHRRTSVVRGTPAAQRNASEHLDAWAIEIGVHF